MGKYPSLPGLCTRCLVLLIVVWLLVSCSSPTPTEIVPANPPQVSTATVIITPEPVGDFEWNAPTTEAYDATASYQLVGADINSLLAIYYGLQFLEYSEASFEGIYSVPNDEVEIHRLLAYELSNYNDSQLTSSLSLIEQLAEQDEHLLDGDLDENRIFAAAFLTALNDEAIDLSNSGTVSVFEYKPTSFDLDHDGTTEWMVQVEIQALKEGRYLPIDIDEAGNYSLMPIDPPLFTWPWSDATYRFDDSHDMNGDGLPDLLFYEEGETSKMRIYVWHNGILQGLSFDPDLDWFQELTMDGYEEIAIEDFDADGVTELRLGRWGGEVSLPPLEYCDYQVDMVEWKGLEVFSTRIEGSEPSQEPECLAAQVLYKKPQPIPDQELLERIVSSLEPADWERSPAFYALVHIKLAAVQFLDGQPNQAQWTIMPIWQYKGDNTSVLFWRELWESSENDFLTFCRSLHHMYWQPDDLWLLYSSGLEEFGDNDPYDDSLEIPMGEYFCPSTTLTRMLLAEKSFPLNFAPEAGLAPEGIPVLFADTANLDSDADLEWVGVVDGGSFLWFLWDATDKGWQGYELAALDNQGVFTSTIDSFEIIMLDVTGDGIDDLVSLREVTEEKYSDEGSTPKYFLAAYDLDAGTLLFDDYVQITEINEVDQDLVDTLISRRAARSSDSTVFHIILNGEEEALYLFLHSVVEQLIEGVDPTLVRNNLEQALIQIPADEVNAELAIRQIQYLIGYCYELEGDSVQAISNYRSLIEEAPDSYWSWLAMARLGL